MSSSPQKFKFPDEHKYAHLGEEEMHMLMDLAKYKVERQIGWLGTNLTAWVLVTPKDEHYTLPTCTADQRTREAFLMFMYLHAGENYQ